MTKIQTTIVVAGCLFSQIASAEGKQNKIEPLPRDLEIQLALSALPDGKLGGIGPFVIMPRHHGLMIQPRGETEIAAITEEHAEMLGRLCKIKDLWCLPRK